jgi:hypothetical protein
MNSYPLYDELIKQIKEKPNKNIDISQMCLTINSLSFLDKETATEHYEEIFALLMHHEYVENNGILFSKVPNDGNILPGDSGVLYTPEKLPVRARQLIDQYIEYYSRK